MFALVLYWSWTAGVRTGLPARLCVTASPVLGVDVSAAAALNLTVSDEKFDCP